MPLACSLSCCAVLGKAVVWGPSMLMAAVPHTIQTVPGNSTLNIAPSLFHIGDLSPGSSNPMLALAQLLAP